MERTRRRKHELTGQRIGSLLVIEKSKTKYDGVVGWKCICDCGNECIKTTHQLVSVLDGKIKRISCGCNLNRGDDLTGKRFGRLIVINKASTQGKAKWICKCDCGNTCETYADYLLSGHKKSCGCYEKENRDTVWTRSYGGRTLAYGTRSRRYNERLYNVWNGMKTRCYNPNNSRYKDYGGRGIVVCEEWKHSFPTFQKWALDNGYDANAPFGECTIDRIDVNGNYEPSNCRWVSMVVQQYNKR